MSNIYICFTDKGEMDNFILDFLNLRPWLEESHNEKCSKKKSELIQKGIFELLSNVENGLYRRLYRFYPGGRVPAAANTLPWTAPGLFVQGIRSIYLKKSYMHRPGVWLAIDLRNSHFVNDKRTWILENVPQSRIGLNVPLPESYILKQRLETVKRIISFENPYPQAETALEYLIEIKEKQPQLFKKEAVYLWEDLARIFDSMDMPEKAVFCFETQADLMPGCADPYLNLSVLYQLRGQLKEAVATIFKGLKVDPKDEYLYYNLSSLLMQNGIYDIALKYLNSAILENPGRGLNYYLKGDIHFNRHEYHAAITVYEWALNIFDDTWESIAQDCRLKLAESYERVGNKEQAAMTRAQKTSDTKETTIGKLYYETGELRYDGLLKDDRPFGPGIKYFKNGQIEMEGIFGDWFIEQGNEYYPNGELKYEGLYNSGPRDYL